MLEAAAPVDQKKAAVMKVKFEHHRIELTDEELRKYGSPHFSKKEVGEGLQKIINARAGRPIFSDTFQFHRRHILSANEVFSECATADPIADLEVWDEWQNGGRHFPFPGQYSRLSISEQKGKVASSTALGVLGEIFTGLFCQCFISPWVLVRPIRRWPDFIYYSAGGRYAFVESKCFTGQSDNSGANLKRISGTLLKECLIDTVNQLNADPFVSVWLVFTELNEIDPLRFSVTALEFDAPDEHRDQIMKRVIPDAVIKGLTERVLSSAVASKDDSILNHEDGSFSKIEIQQFWDEILGIVPEETERIIANSAPAELYSQMKSAIVDEAQEIVSKRKKAPQVSDRGHRFEKAKRLASMGQLGRLRPIGAQHIYLADLTSEIRLEAERLWSPTWSNVNQSLCCLSEIELYRCSSVAVGISGQNCEGKSVDRQVIQW